MHAIDGVRVDEIVDGFAFARFRWANHDLGLSPLHRAGRDLDSWGNCSGRFAAPSAPIARRSADRANSSIADRAPIARGSGAVAENREEDSHHPR
jgi:hypothetical protein